MEKLKYSIKSLIVLVAVGAAVWACTKKAEFVNPPTKLKIQVLRQGNKPLKNAKVAIFSSEDDFNIARPNYRTSEGDFEGLTDAQGYVYFDSVSSNVRYYVLCKYDSLLTGITGLKDTIAWSNVQEDYQFLNPLKPNTVTTAQVFVSASDGFVNFWTTNTYVNIYPIGIKIGGFSVDSLRTVGLNNGRSVKLRAGQYTYTAKSPYGCTWIDTLNVKVGKHVNEELQRCSLVRVTIAAHGTIDKAKFPITVVLNTTDTLSTKITAAVPTTALVACGVVNSIAVTRPEGTYSFQFIGNDNTVKLGTTKFEAPIRSNCDTLVVKY